MPIIAARRYARAAQAQDLSPTDLAPEANCPPPAEGFDWIGVSDPTPEEMERLRLRYGLHPLAVEDALNPNQMPKVDAYGDQLFIAARTAHIHEGDRIEYGQTTIFLGEHFVVTVRIGSVRGYAPLRERLEKADAQRLIEGPDFVAHAVLDYIVDGYQPIMDGLEDVVNDLEKAAIEAFPQTSTVRRIFRLRRRLRRFTRVIGPMEEMCLRLASAQLPAIDPAAHIWFADVYDHVRRTLHQLGGLKETLASIMETASLLEQQRQGEMTRKLAAWAAILAVPTAIAGVYGMNFEFMPELKWHYGYFGALAVMAGACGTLFVRFKAIRWL